MVQQVTNSLDITAPSAGSDDMGALLAALGADTFSQSKDNFGGRGAPLASGGGGGIPPQLLEALGKMLGGLGEGQGQQQLQPNLPPLTRGQGGTLQIGRQQQADPRQQAMAIAQMFARQQQLQQQQQGGLAGLLGLGKNILG